MQATKTKRPPGSLRMNLHAFAAVCFTLVALIVGFIPLAGTDDIIKFFIGMSLLFAYAAGWATRAVQERSAKVPKPLPFGPVVTQYAPPAAPGEPDEDEEGAPEPVEVRSFSETIGAGPDRNGSDPHRPKDPERFEF